LSNVQIIEGDRVFVAPGINAQLDAHAEHLDAEAYPTDLLNPHLSPGEAKTISPLDVAIIQASYDAWEDGFVAGSDGAPLTALMPQNAQLATRELVTAEAAEVPHQGRGADPAQPEPSTRCLKRPSGRRARTALGRVDATNV
jgi:hypothetical protein